MLRRRSTGAPTTLAALVAALSLSCLAPLPVRAQGRLSGTVFADAAWNAADHRAADSLAFRFRRVQLTFDNDLDSAFAVRFQIEADDGDLTSRGKMAFFVKQAWLRWARLGAAGDLTLGLATTPTWSVAEGAWGYRSLEKNILDLNGLGASTDIGLALQRAPSPARPLGWHLMLSNGNGQKPENDRAKKVALSVPVRAGDWLLEAMGDFEGEPGPRDRWTVKLLAAWQGEAGACGLEGFRRVNAAAGAAGADVTPAGASGFARAKLNARWRAIGRLDWYDPNSRVSDAGYRELFAVAALDYAPRAGVHVMPNVLVRRYAGKGPAVPDRDTDVTVRVTLHYNYR